MSSIIEETPTSELREVLLGKPLSTYLSIYIYRAIIASIHLLSWFLVSCYSGIIVAALLDRNPELYDSFQVPVMEGFPFRSLPRSQYWINVDEIDTVLSIGKRKPDSRYSVGEEPLRRMGKLRYCLEQILYGTRNQVCVAGRSSIFLTAGIIPPTQCNISRMIFICLLFVY